MIATDLFDTRFYAANWFVQSRSLFDETGGTYSIPMYSIRHPCASTAASTTFVSSFEWLWRHRLERSGWKETKCLAHPSLINRLQSSCKSDATGRIPHKLWHRPSMNRKLSQRYIWCFIRLYIVVIAMIWSTSFDYSSKPLHVRHVLARSIRQTRRYWYN